jgi:hypothetical protein
MRYLSLLLVLLGSAAFGSGASKGPILGTYSAFTEADWTVAFDLKSGGKAVVITESSYEYDSKGKRVDSKKTVDGSWEFKHPVLILTYDGFRDKFVQSNSCHEKKPCFKYDSPVESKSGKSPLNVNYEFINWDSGNGR